VISKTSSKYVLNNLSWHRRINRSPQCAIPVFDGLLPEPHNRQILKLLFLLAYWHGLAKLRLHTDTTLDVMDAVTTDLGNEVRAFKKRTCVEFATKELHRESAARLRRQSRSSQPHNPNTRAERRSDIASASASTSASGPQTSASNRNAAITNSHGGTRRPKTLNLNTYKWHALGDYADTIRKFGTTDSYSTEPVCPSNYVLSHTLR
jgi:hypothetical protein